MNLPRPIGSFALAALLCAGRAAAASLTLPDGRQLNLTRSPVGRHTVVGTNALENLDLARWADLVDEKLTRLTGLDLPPPAMTSVRIAIRAGAPPAVITHPPGQGADARQRHLELVNYAEAPIEAVGCALVALRLDAQAGAAGAWPAWLVRGLWRNLDPDRRAADADWLLDQWRSGRVPPLRAFLTAPDGTLTGATAAAQAALTTAWLLSGPERGARLTGFLSDLASATNRTDAADRLAARLGVEAAPAALEEAWDRWMARQSRMVRQPGRVAALDLERLRTALLLSPGASGIPLVLKGEPPRQVRDLIAHRRASWAPAAASAKRAELALLAVGRGPAFAAVTDAYAAFLAAMAARARTGRLTALLAAAEQAQTELERNLATPADAPAETIHDGTRDNNP